MAILIDPVSIEPMRRADLDAVFRIDRRCFPVPWLAGAYLTELSNRSACYLVARLNQEVIGYAGEWVIMDEAHITTLAVDPAHQGAGGVDQGLALVPEGQAFPVAHPVGREDHP